MSEASIYKPVSDFDRRIAAAGNDEAKKRDIRKLEEALRAQMSPPGALGLHPWLEKRRQEFSIPDGVFQAQPTYDSVTVYQVDRVQSERFEGSLIVRPEALQDRNKFESATGILIDWGLTAMDNLRCHGHMLGDIVIFIRNAPWRTQVSTVNGKACWLIQLRDGDIRGNYDLKRRLKEGEMQVVARETETGTEHHLVDMEGKEWKQRELFTPADY